MKIVNATSLLKLSLVSLISVLIFVFLTGCNDNAVSTSGKSISISAVKETVWEGDTAVFRILLSEPNKTGSDLKVFFTLSGSAVEGRDYDSIYNGGFILIPKDSQSVYIRTEINHDSLLEETESLTINLTGSDGGEYNTGLNNSATVVLMDGDGPTFTDPRDGKVYHTVLIGRQTWMVENLAYAPSSGNYWAYENNNANVKNYGYLYDWHTALNVCPTGWHLPSDAEWTQLTTYLGGSSIAGGKLKATGTIQAGTGLWYAPNTGATNETGFTALPGGHRRTYGSFGYVGDYGYWWSATELSTDLAWYRGMTYHYSDVGRSGNSKEGGFSVRCLRD